MYGQACFLTGLKWGHWSNWAIRSRGSWQRNYGNDVSHK